jgi:hypothetical protein
MFCNPTDARRPRIAYAAHLRAKGRRQHTAIAERPQNVHAHCASHRPGEEASTRPESGGPGAAAISSSGSTPPDPPLVDSLGLITTSGRPARPDNRRPCPPGQKSQCQRQRDREAPTEREALPRVGLPGAGGGAQCPRRRPPSRAARKVEQSGPAAPGRAVPVELVSSGAARCPGPAGDDSARR